MDVSAQFSNTLHCPENNKGPLLEEIDATEEELISQSRGLPQQERVLAEQMIGEMCSSLRDKIKQMKLLGNSPEIISLTVKKELKDIRSSSENFFRNCQSFGQNKIETTRKITGLASNIDNFAGYEAFSDFTSSQGNGLPEDSPLDFIKANHAASMPSRQNEPESNAKELKDVDPLWAMKKANIEQNMALAGMGAVAVRILIEEPLKAVGILNENHTVLPAGEERPKSEALADILERDFQIPREQARQYNEDSFRIVNVALEVAALRLGVKGGVAAGAATDIGLNAIKSNIPKLAPSISGRLAFNTVAPIAEGSALKTVPQSTLRNFLNVENGGVKLSKTVSEKAYSSKIAAKLNSDFSSKLPNWPRKKWIKLIEKIGYEQKKGGKGSHGKWVKPDDKNDPMIIIPKDNDLSTKVAQDLWRVCKKIIERDF